MFPTQQFPGQRQKSWSVPGVHAWPPGNNPVHSPTTSSATPPLGSPCGAPGRLAICIAMRRYDPPVDPGNHMQQGLWTCPHCHRFPATIMMQIMRAMIHRTWMVQRANHQSLWSTLNSRWCNWPQGWGRPTTGCSTFGRKYGWLGFWGRSIPPSSGVRTIWMNVNINHCTGTKQLQILRRHSRTGWHWLVSIMPNRFSAGALRCLWRHVQAKFERWGNWEGRVIIDQRQIRESACANRDEVTAQCCQIQCSWLWFARCEMEMMSFYPPNSSKPCI